ncbi:MAG: DUF4338 domain-containing protein [Candidatus Accumulibacter sp.]|uniref:DUF4338 domain-containing protein n=1 Tax=Candidatus Accumulibacter affinis TaxID=2954384 RepID=A0A935TBX3_9PROT|nr:DUF4338 domain-containing protein [Candidatus Accumulibacter affinis]
MNTRGWVHCGREFSAAEIADLCATVAWLPGLPRQELAATLCEHLAWFTLSGTPKIHACLEFLERLRVAGLLALPALRPSPPRRSTAPAAAVEPVAEPLVHCALSALAPVSLEVVRDAAVGAQWDALVARWHPLGFQGAFGYRLRYFILAGDGRLGCVLLAGAARAVAVRDRWIGWTAQARRENVARVVEQQPLPDLSPRPGSASGQPCARTTRAPRTRRLARSLGLRAPAARDLRRSASLCRYLLPRRRLAVAWGDQRAWAGPPRPVLSEHAPPGVGQAALRRWSRPAVRRPWELPVMSRRPTRATIQGLRAKKKQQEKALNAKLRASGQVPHSPASLPNRCSTFATIAERERPARTP